MAAASPPRLLPANSQLPRPRLLRFGGRLLRHRRIRCVEQGELVGVEALRARPEQAAQEIVHPRLELPDRPGLRLDERMALLDVVRQCLGEFSAHRSLPQ